MCFYEEKKGVVGCCTYSWRTLTLDMLHFWPVFLMRSSKILNTSTVEVLLVGT